MKTLLALISIALLLPSCERKDEPKPVSTYYCPKQTLQPVFRGFGYDEYDTVVLRRYRKGGGFTEKLSERLFSNPDPVGSETGKLSLKNSFEGFVLDDSADHIIYIPALNASYHISEVEYNMQLDSSIATTGRYNYCYSPVKSIKLNGQQVIADNNMVYMPPQYTGHRLAVVITK